MEQRPAIRRRLLLVGFLLSLGVYALVGLAVFAGRALADEPPVYTPPAEIASEPPAPEGQPSCPDLELEAFEGEDAAAGEVRLLRGESAEACAAISARLDRIRERLWWMVAEALVAGGRAELSHELLEQIGESVGEPTCPMPCPVLIDGDSPVEVQDSSSQEYNDELVSAVDASGEASKAALWFIAGLLVAGVIAYMIIRAVRDGT